jgi:hypothetical protein
MAAILDQITVGDVKLIVADAAPDFGAAQGSLAFIPDSGTLYYKNGALDTEWAEVITNAGLTEKVQDAVGAALTNSANITFTYNDGANAISADLTDIISAASVGAANKTLSVSVDAKGRVTSATAQDILITASQVSDFNSAVSAYLGFTAAKATAQTTSATFVELFSVPVPTDSVALVKATVSGLSTGGATAVYERTASIKQVSGVTTVVATQSDFTSEENPLGPCNCTFAVNAGNLTVRIDGLNGQTINWKGTLQVHRPS